MINILNEININDIKNLAVLAGKEIMDIYQKDFKIEYKDDNSPITQADKISNEIICFGLKKLYKNIPIISEENKEVPFDFRKDWPCYWCIDPLDGTREFIKKSGEFTVNIALIQNNIPVLGVIYAPFFNELYYSKKNENAFLEILDKQNKTVKTNKLPLKVNSNKDKNLSVILSKSRFSKQTEDFIEDLKTTTEKLNILKVGSSLKLCMVAKGRADICPSLYNTMEWDTAAANAILIECKKSIKTYQTNDSLKYNKNSMLNNMFIAQ